MTTHRTPDAVTTLEDGDKLLTFNLLNGYTVKAATSTGSMYVLSVLKDGQFVYDAPVSFVGALVSPFEIEDYLKEVEAL